MHLVCIQIKNYTCRSAGTNDERPSCPRPLRGANNCSSSRPSYFKTSNMPPNITPRLSQLTSGSETSPGEPLVHMATRRRRRRDSLRKRRPLSALICRLPRRVFSNEPDLAIRVEEPVDLHEERGGRCEWVCFFSAGLTLRIWLAVNEKHFHVNFRAAALSVIDSPLFPRQTPG